MLSILGRALRSNHHIARWGDTYTDIIQKMLFAKPTKLNIQLIWEEFLNEMEWCENGDCPVELCSGDCCNYICDTQCDIDDNLEVQE